MSAKNQSSGLASEIENILAHIANSDLIYHRAKQPFALINQKGTAILFYAYYYLQYAHEAAGDIALALLEESISEANNRLQDSSLATGITGLGWLIQHLANIGFLGADDTAALSEIDHVVEERIETDFQARNYDLLYGLIGKGLYLLERPESIDTDRALSRIVVILAELAVAVRPGELAWENLLEQPDSTLQAPIYTLGLAHGNASVLAFLGRVHARGIQQQLIEELVPQSCRWLHAQTLAPDSLSVFPTHAGLATPSRLAWCQGDLGVALALESVEHLMPPGALQPLLNRLYSSLSARTLATAGISIDEAGVRVDTTLCHGTIGAGYMLARLHHPAPQQAASRWIEQTVALIEAARANGRTASGIEAETWMGPGQGYEWREDLGLLQGVFGVGLSLLAWLHPQARAWSAFLLADGRVAVAEQA